MRWTRSAGFNPPPCLLSFPLISQPTLNFTRRGAADKAGVLRSLHHALLSKRIQVLREKLTDLERRKQELRIDSGKDSHTYEELESQKETLQRTVDEVRKRLETIMQEKEVLDKETDMQLTAEIEQEAVVQRLLKNIETSKREINIKSKSMAESEKTVADLKVGHHPFFMLIASCCKHVFLLA